jgi:hypothetical protein
LAEQSAADSRSRPHGVQNRPKYRTQAEIGRMPPGLENLIFRRFLPFFA